MTTGVVKDDDDNNLLMDEDILENTKNSMFSHVRNGNLSYNNKSRSSTVTPLKEIAYFSQNQQRQCFLGGNSDLKSNGKNSILLEEMMGSITGTLNQSADCLTNSGNSFEILEDDKVLGNNTTPMMLEVKLQSPSLSESKFLNMNNSPTRLNNSNRYHYLKRKISKPNIIKHRPSRLDLLDSGLTSFPIDPPNLDSAEPNKDSDGALNGDGALHTNNDQDNSNLDTTHQSSIVLIEDYIEEKKTLNQNKSISILDFKKSIGEIEKKNKEILYHHQVH
ncbi:hypothetical protein PACTADRAFT_5186 [Pachysolen tannophilus NRRL Y-2460]|uniref:Uncharacterized protein n=1 Tax=Pachysolen tannophilus NRRL Y-2460 TaxID=669874 RepID=A0A1E4TNS5_PACTA|nr:hypothetical protein PACTADRAFT_5186 [Pachysolen tannophilus NRRL Y-2460]